MREAFQVILLVVLIVSPMLDGSIKAFSYTDELTAILLVGWGLFRKDKVALNDGERIGILAVALLLALGLASNFATGYQQNNLAIAVDAFTCFKVFAAYYGALQVVHGEERILSLAICVAKLLIVAALFGYALHLSGVVSMGDDRHFMGVPCYRFVFGHTTELAAYCVGISALLMTDANKNKVWIVFDILLLLSTMRTKAVGIAFVIGFFLVRCLVTGRDKKPTVFLYLILVIGVLFLGADQMKFYFGDTTSARYLLQSNSMQIAQSFFPFGSGFGTYASYMSGEYYSPLYYLYGLSGVYGLSPDYHAFVSDSFWPTVIGQFGFFGLALFTLLIGTFFYSFVSRSRSHRVPVGAYVIIPLYYLILSTADASFFNFYGPFYALVMAIVATDFPSKIERGTEGFMRNYKMKDNG
ncbi:O-antigen ligase [uncultured Ellagibacter sp.]|uniref:O-antigen ligase family protein n=1 Tax=uncultured Ellagibacter sp. TaxID=2137580 RepID=UPI002639C80F|nr:hypothetical protein [uncultured Ellagibacter sp.]